MSKNKSRHSTKPARPTKRDQEGPKPVNPFDKKEITPDLKAQEQEENELEQQRKETLTERD
jgi:hypothetical protein